jgi:hypothetical protein
MTCTEPVEVSEGCTHPGEASTWFHVQTITRYFVKLPLLFRQYLILCKTLELRVTKISG